MAKKLLNFGSFNEYNRILEDYKSLENTATELNEAFASNILRNFAAQESGTRWQSGLSKDFYKFANIPLDKVTNEDFIVLSNPEEWWTQKYAKNDSAVGFFVDDNPEFLKALKKKGKDKARSAYGVILTIMRANRGMWYGFAKDPGQSFSRYKKNSSERYGILADEYSTAGVYGWDGAKSKAKITKNNLIEVATKVYVLDINILREKYGSTKELKGKRAEAKQGALALQTAETFRKQQKERYTQILREKLDPNVMLSDVKDALSTYTDWMSKEIAELKFDPKAEVKENFYREMQVRWQGWDADWSRPINNMLDVLNNFMKNWNDYLREQAKVEQLAKKMEDENDEQKIQRLKGEIAYYEGGYERFVKSTIKYRDELRKYTKSVKELTTK